MGFYRKNTTARKQQLLVYQFRESRNIIMSGVLPISSSQLVHPHSSEAGVVSLKNITSLTDLSSALHSTASAKIKAVQMTVHFKAEVFVQGKSGMICQYLFSNATVFLHSTSFTCLHDINGAPCKGMVEYAYICEGVY